MTENGIVFQITKEDVQNEAIERIGRKLTENEIDIAKKGIEWGLGDITLMITYDTIFNEMIKEVLINEN
jgi:hypothetical protein